MNRQLKPRKFAHHQSLTTMRWTRSLFCSTVLLTTGYFGLEPAIAAPPNLGSCPFPAYISQGTSSSSIKLNSVNLLTGKLTTISSTAIPNGVNGIGFNQKDGYIYGIEFGSNRVKRIDANGVSYDLGAIAGLPSNVGILSSYVVGDVDANGVLHVLAQGGNTIYAIDVTEASPTYLQLLRKIPITIPVILDFAFHPTNGKLYTANSSGNIYEISLPTGTGSATVKTLGTSVLPAGGSFDPYGSIYFASDGSLYTYINSGAIYKVTNLLGPGSIIVETLTTNAAQVQQNDGARCALAPPIFSNTGTALVNVSGTVFHDKDANVFINGTDAGTNAGSTNLTVYAVDANGLVVDKAVVGADGRYTLTQISTNSNLTLRLSNDATVPLGNTAPTTSSLPTGWRNTGENKNGTPETTTLGDIAITTTTTNILNQDFGINQLLSNAKDYGDAPDTYGTDSTNNNGEGVGASHVITNTLKLGATAPDAETDAATPLDGTGDGADEDAFTSLPNVPTTGNYNLTVPVTNSGSSATLHAWIDFNKNGKFEVGEYQSATVANGATTANLSWAVPSGTTAGNTYARFRLTSDASLADNTATSGQDERSIGAANDGEVEDYAITIVNPVSNTCVLPASTFNSSNYSLNTPLQNSLPLTFFGGSMQFNAFLSGTGTWNNGVQVQNGLWANGVNGDYLYLQPKDTPSFTTSGNRANYVLSFPAPVTNFGAVLAGLNDTDGTTITASYRGVPIQITAANFSNLSANMVLVDADGDGQMDTVVGNNVGGGAAVNINTYDLNIAGPIDNITIFSGKNEPRITTPTIAMYALQYCYNSSSSSKANVLLIKRITEINGDRTQNPNDTTKRLDGYINSPSPNDDPTLNWPSNYLIGSNNAGLTKPGDVIEYTVYFMNANGSYATAVKLCDRILGAQQFLADAYGAGKDIEYKLGTNAIQYLTKASLASVDGAELNPSTSAIAGCPAPSITGTNNGTVVLDVTGNTGTGQVNITALPGATAPGTPSNSYGYFRFKVKVDP